MAVDIKLLAKLDGVLAKYEYSCRLCLMPTANAKDGVSLFATYANNIPMSQLVEDSVNIQLAQDDMLPKRICCECAHIIQKFTAYRSKCESNDRALREIFNVQLKAEEPIKTEHELPASTTKPRVILTRVNVQNQQYSIKVDEDAVTGAGELGTDDYCLLSDDADYDMHGEQQQPWTAVKPTRTEFDGANTKKASAEKTRKVCEECGLTFSTACTLRRHRITHTGIKDFCCDICNTCFSRKFHLEMHMRIHFKIRPHVCETCASTFSTSSDLSRHRRVHVDVKNYACVLCARRFKRSSDVTKHMRTHSGEKPYSCKDCNKSYASHSGLTKHLRRYHPDKTSVGDDGEDEEKGNVTIVAEPT